MNGLILIAHGSKKDLSNNEFLALVDEIKTKDENFDQVKASFLEFAYPDIKTIVEEYIAENITKIYFYPYFLNSGKHVTNDLPDIINDLTKNNPLIEFILLTHFGKSDKISDIILSDIKRETLK
jgi:sirohydrochlorin cobaltochelatase